MYYKDVLRKILKNRVKPPLGYPGNKFRSLHHILPHLPMQRGYCEPFGGMGTILLNRQKSQFEILNDKYSAVAELLLVLQSPKYLEKFTELCETTLHSRQFFYWCEETWYQQTDIVDRAFRWYYFQLYSFGQQGRHFGRSTGKKNSDSGKLLQRISGFPPIHERLKNVLIENQDAMDIITDFDSSDMTFYLDPPYLDTYEGIYKYTMRKEEHKSLLDLIFRSKGFFAISTYKNDLYESYPWDDRIIWEVNQKMQSMAFTVGNNLIGCERTHRDEVSEVLYIKGKK